MIELWVLLFLVALCFAVGAIGSVAGLVLGNLRLPVLLALLPAAVAGGTNIAISGAGAGAGALTHLREGRFDRTAFWIMAPPSLVGAVLGGVLAGLLPGELLIGIMALIVLEQGAELLYANYRRPADRTAPPTAPRTRRWVLLLGASGFAIGVLGGLVGLILGTIRLPAMLRAGLPAKTAVGTNLAVGFVVGIAGLAGHLLAGTVDGLLVLELSPPAILGSVLGARLAGTISEHGLRRVIGLILVGVAALLIALLALRAPLGG